MDLAKLLSLFLIYKYPVIFLITFIEGAMIMTICGFFLHLGYVSFWPVYLTLMAGDLTGDIVWYNVGSHFAHPLVEKYGKYFGLTPALVEKTRNVFQNHQKKILFLSKITMGFGLPLVALLVAGMSKMPFRKYITSLFFGQIFYTGILIALGYFFGDLYVKINKDFQIIAAVAFFALLAFLLHGIRSYLRNKNA